MSLDVDENCKDSRYEDGTGHEVECLLGLQLAESKAKSDSSAVASGTNNSSNGSSDGRVNIWHNTVGGSLSTLDNGGEDDHDEDGKSKAGSVGKDEDHNSLQTQQGSLPDEASLHAHLKVHLIRYEPSNTTSEEIHPAEDGGNGSRTLRGELELGLEVRCGGIVHRELDFEAARVLNEEDPGVDVGGSGAEGGGNLGHGAVLLHLGVVALGRVVGDAHDGESEDESDGGGDEANGAPGGLGGHAGLEEGEEDGSHDDLGDSSSEVSPSSHEGVGGAGDLLGEHAGGPELAADEGGSAESDEETEDAQGSCCEWIDSLFEI